MSAPTELPRRPVPVSAADHRRRGLLPGWKFYHLPPTTKLVCSICSTRRAAYLSPPMAFCAKHARDF